MKQQHGIIFHGTLHTAATAGQKAAPAVNQFKQQGCFSHFQVLSNVNSCRPLPKYVAGNQMVCSNSATLVQAYLRLYEAQSIFQC